MGADFHPEPACRCGCEGLSDSRGRVRCLRPVFPAGARSVFRPRSLPCTHRSGYRRRQSSTTLVTKDTGLGTY
jgi:hypothetical protein